MDKADMIETMNSMVWYHKIELAPGVVTPGNEWDVMWEPMRTYHRQFDFAGKRVLEIGCWDAYWSFEAERLGAAEVWATDDLSQRRPFRPTVPFAVECRGSRIHYRGDVSVYEVDRAFAEKFDVVIFYGVLYHLRYPVMALAALRNVLKTGGTLLLETAVTLEDRRVMAWGHEDIYPGDVSTWNAPSLSCLRFLLETGYFDPDVCEVFLRQDEQRGIGRAYARAVAVERGEQDRHAVPDRLLAAHNPRFRPKIAREPSPVDVPFEEFARMAERWAMDAASFAPIEQLRKFLFYYDQLKDLQDVPGDLLEFGIWRGSTLVFLSDANWLLDGPNSSRHVIGFDTFQGFPDAEGDTPWSQDRSQRHLFTDTSRALVERKLHGRPNPRVKVVAGDISETLPLHLAAWPNRIALAICDADRAEVTEAILDGIWDRMSPGGRIFFDEYSRDGWSETTGVERFLKRRSLSLSVVKRTRGAPFGFIQM